jgi:hypothetical protein
MNFEIVESGWDRIVDDALQFDSSRVLIISPFIKARSAARFLNHGTPNEIRVITRFNIDDFVAGVSDTRALRLLLEKGARIRGVQYLHSKLYVIGNRVIVTSANLTESALTKNHEFGFVSDDEAVLGKCCDYFESLWQKSAGDLELSKVLAWETSIENYLATAPMFSRKRLGDEGADVELLSAPVQGLPGWFGDSDQWFVKFFGQSNRRAARTARVYDEVKISGCHWACTYPKGKRPRQVSDGAIMLIARLVKNPEDIIIYGRAVGMKHVPGRDDASPDDIALRDWKGKWPHYIRVHNPEFIAGSLSNGISMKEMMSELRADCFESTKKNALTAVGNTDPRFAYRQQPAVELTKEGFSWLHNRMEDAFVRHGKIPAADLRTLDRPVINISPDQEGNA